MERLLIASHNAGKIKEFKQLFEKYGISVSTLAEVDFSDDIEETGETFEENALIKARAIAKVFDVPVLADDSGLEIDALDQRPGVYSARYAGAARSDAANMDKVLRELGETPLEKRTARFVCVLALVDPNGEEIVVRGECEGLIGHEKQGTHGFGYDPIFYLPDQAKTMAQLTKEEKNLISHRSVACRLLEERIGEKG